jgi:hypothetical protein
MPSCPRPRRRPRIGAYMASATPYAHSAEMKSILGVPNDRAVVERLRKPLLTGGNVGRCRRGEIDDPRHLG